MGHSRLGPLPRTRKWQEVVALFGTGAEVAQIAQAVLHAADARWSIAKHPGIATSFWCLTQVTAAATDQDFGASLRQRGFTVHGEPTVAAVVAAVAAKVDESMPRNRGRTDLGEMAQAAVVETLNRIVTARVGGLFWGTGEQVQAAFKELGTKKNFGVLGREFFGQFIGKVLQQYVSREISLHAGPGQRFTTLREVGAFESALDVHCRQASVIVEKFAGSWKSKAAWESRGAGISLDDARRFSQVALNKCVKELKEGAR